MTNEKLKNLRLSVAGCVAAVGFAVVVRGVYLWSRAGGWVLAGLFVAVPALFVAYDAFREK